MKTTFMNPQQRQRNGYDITGFIPILILIIIIIYGLTSCSSTSKMVKPDGCKPTKEVKHKMIKPTYYNPDKR